MAAFIAPFDPSLAASGTFPVQLVNGGWLFIHNESPIELSFQVGTMGAPVLVPAYVARCFPAALNTSLVSWKREGIIAGAGQAPISQVFGEQYAPNEWGGGELYVPLSRQVNLGNQAAGGTVTAIVNDGNAAATSVLEATPLGQGASSLALNNDASGFIQVLSANTLKKILNVVRGDTGATKAIVTLGDSADRSILTFQGVLAIFNCDGGKIVSTGAGVMQWANTLSSANQLTDFQQGYGLYSDNVGTFGTTRTWFNGPDRGELHLGPRTGSNYFDWIRLRATRVRVELGVNASPNAKVFEVQGGQTTLDDAKFSTDGNGNLSKVGNQAAVGFGVPVIVAQALYVTVAVTTLQTILSFTAPADGDYRVSATALLNGTLPASPALLISYTEPLLSGTPTAYFMTTGQSGAMTVLSGSQATFTPPTSLPCPPITIRAKGGTTITVKYQDGVGVPNDRVSAFIERLS